MNPIKYAIILIVLFNCSGCYGPPDSFFVNIVGRDLPDFVDMTKRQEREIALQGDYKILYLKKDYDGSDKSRLLLKDLKTETEDVLLEGHLGYDIDYASFSSEGNFVWFTFHDIRSSEEVIYICSYNLSLKKISSKDPLLDMAAYKNPQIFLGAGAIISDLFFDSCGTTICFSVSYRKGASVVDYSHDFYVYNLSNKMKTMIGQEKYDELKNSIESNQVRGYSYLKNGKKLQFFSIVPYSDYLPANYKPKYNGVYISDGSRNIRISRDEVFSESAPIWIENGTKILYSSYIFDATGKYKKLKLVEGKILSVRKN